MPNPIDGTVAGEDLYGTDAQDIIHGHGGDDTIYNLSSKAGPPATPSSSAPATWCTTSAAGTAMAGSSTRSPTLLAAGDYAFY